MSGPEKSILWARKCIADAEHEMCDKADAFREAEMEKLKNEGFDENQAGKLADVARTYYMTGARIALSAVRDWLG